MSRQPHRHAKAAVRLYQAGYPVKGIVMATGMSLSTLYVELFAAGVKTRTAQELEKQQGHTTREQEHAAKRRERIKHKGAPSGAEE